MQFQNLKQHIISPAKGIFEQLVRYVFSGGIAFVVDFGLLWFVTSVCHAHYLVGAFCGYTVGLIITYLLSIKWIFNERKLENAKLEFIIFTCIGLCGLLLTQACMYCFTEFLLGTENYLYSKLITTVIVALFNFVMKKILLFTNKKE